MHNEHVYVYYRWRSWVAAKRHSQMGQWLYAEWAEQEHEAQREWVKDDV